MSQEKVVSSFHSRRHQERTRFSRFLRRHKLSYFIARKSLERIERKSHEFFNTENGKSYFALPPLALAPAVLPRDLIIQINFSSLRPRQKIKPVKITANPRNIPSPQLLISFESFCAKLKRFPSDPEKRFSKNSSLGIPIKGLRRLTDTLLVIGRVDLQTGMAGALERAGQVVADLLAAVLAVALVDVCRIRF